MEKIKNLLIDKYDNHVLPFLWMHGENEDKIREYMRQISNAGIGAVCIESRPHEDFLEERWWQDVDIIIDECEKRDMKLWILDDKHFPTGYANGEIKKNHPELQKMFLTMKQFDFVGPKKNAGVLLKWVLSGRPNVMQVGVDQKEEEEVKESQIKAVIAAKKTRYEGIDSQTLINLTDNIKEDTLYWDIPAGDWSILVFTETNDGGEESTNGYLNPIVKEATDVLIDTVYQAHFDHYSDKFGNVIQGFFSDEPRFGNIKGPDAKIGIDMPLPWRPGFEKDLAAKLELSVEETILKLPLLFREDTDLAASVRYGYMDLITDLYKENFSERIGDWCKNHHVEYIGHVIEDNNAHARLGYGPGHFFKSMAGQDMSGIDVVLHQLLPQQNNSFFKSMTSTGWDGEFFHYALAKMGASLGHLDPKKQGRTMCEVFGAYGWSEGTKLMKWISDHMLVRGVNQFVPHAFTMKAFPDPDCPPHFYGNGHNPQFPYFHLLIKHLNRLGYLLSGGNHYAEIGILYHAEAEWAGKAMFVQKVSRELTENQIEFEIIPKSFIENALINRGSYQINQQQFKTLIVPYAERLPLSLLQRLLIMQQAGISIIFIDGLPISVSDSSEHEQLLEALKQQVNVINLEEIAAFVDSSASRLITDKKLSFLRFYQYQQSDGQVFMLFNENTIEDMEFKVIFPTSTAIAAYNPVTNEAYRLKNKDGLYAIKLAKGESMIYFEDHANIFPLLERNERKLFETSLNDQGWDIMFSGEGLSEKAERQLQVSELPILGNGDAYSYFAGKITYKTEIMKADTLTIDNASEIVIVYLNDQYVGTRISSPYSFDLAAINQTNKNQLKIEVINNLGKNQRDFLSQFIESEPLGISGNIRLLSSEH